jgi:mannose-6-phosphate isomerase-like protein (cupin superfamily)
MQTIDLHQVVTDMSRSARIWHEFLRVDSMSMGIYRLQPGDTDQQKPHTEDEVYYILSGRAKFKAADEHRDVKAGDVIFVEKLVDHRFFDITEALTILVFFAPAEHTGK